MRVRVRMYAQGFLFSYRHSVIRHSQRPFPLAKIIKKTRICKKNGIFFLWQVELPSVLLPADDVVPLHASEVLKCVLAQNGLRFGPIQHAIWAKTQSVLGQNATTACHKPHLEGSRLTVIREA